MWLLAHVWSLAHRITVAKFIKFDTRFVQKKQRSGLNDKRTPATTDNIEIQDKNIPFK